VGLVLDGVVFPFESDSARDLPHQSEPGVTVGVGGNADIRDNNFMSLRLLATKARYPSDIALPLPNPGLILFGFLRLTKEFARSLLRDRSLIASSAWTTEGPDTPPP